MASSIALILSSASQPGSVTLLTRDDANPATGWVEVRSPGTFDAQPRTAIDLTGGTPSAFLLVGTNQLITIDADRGEVVQYELEQGVYRELRTVPVPVGWIPTGLCSLEKTAVLTARVGDDSAIGVIDTRNGAVKPLAMRWPDGEVYTPSAAKQYPHGAIESMLGTSSRAAAIVDGLCAWVNVNPSTLTCSCQWTCAKEPEIAHVGHGVGDTLLIVRGAERTLSRFASKDGSWIEDLGNAPAGFGKDSLAVLTETSSGRVFFQRESLEPLYTVRDPDTGRWANMTLPGDVVAEDDSGGLVCIQSGKLVRARSMSDSSKPDTLVELQGFMISEAVVTSDGLCCLAEPLVMSKCLTDPSDAGKAPAVPGEPRVLFTDMTGKVCATVELSRSMGSRWLVAVGGDCCVMSSPTKGWLVTSGGEKRSFDVRLTPGAGVGVWYSWLGSTSSRRISLVDQVRGRVWMVDVER